MKLEKFEKYLYILLGCFWFAGATLEDLDIFPWGVIITFKIVKILCFYLFLTYTLLKMWKGSIDNKKFVLVAIGISVFSFLLNGIQALLYELKNPDSAIMALFPLFVFALPLWAFIFDKKEKGSITTPKNIIIITVWSILTLAVLVLDIMTIIDLI